MRIQDVYTQNRRLWVRLHEKGGKQHTMPCHHNLESCLHEYIDGAGLASDPGDGRDRLSQKRRALERAAQMANHASTRTTQLCDRGAEEVTLDEVERALI
jgi:anti-sigma factor RsiW